MKCTVLYCQYASTNKILARVKIINTFIKSKSSSILFVMFPTLPSLPVPSSSRNYSSFLCLQINFIFYRIVCKWNQICWKDFRIWLLSFIIIILRFHLCCVFPQFIFYCRVVFIVGTCHNLFIWLPLNGHQIVSRLWL